MNRARWISNKCKSKNCFINLIHPERMDTRKLPPVFSVKTCETQRGVTQRKQKEKNKRTLTPSNKEFVSHVFYMQGTEGNTKLL